MTKISSLTAEYFRLPLKNPFVISIRSATFANVVRWTLETSDGQTFLGESVPVQYVTGETPNSVLAAAENLKALLYEQPISELDRLTDLMAAKYPSDIAARAGVEIALYNAKASETNTSLVDLLGGHHAILETDLTITRLPNSTEIAKAAYETGFRAFKIKVGGGELKEDIDRVLSIHDALAGCRIRLDGNQALTVKDSILLVETLLARGVNIELLEQPVPKEDIPALGEVARESAVPVIADEACKTAQDAYEIFSTTEVDGVNVKLMKSGIKGALEIIKIAKAAGKKLMIGCMLESEIGMTAGVALACGTAAFDYVDLDGHLLLDLDKPVASFVAHGPSLYFARAARKS